jgi:hypothetical protein
VNRLEESNATIVDAVNERLGATGASPPIYSEDSFGYPIELIYGRSKHCL